MKTTTACALALVLLASAGIASADDGHDACLVGTWVQTGGGPGEWMQQRMPAQQVQVQQPRGVMTLAGDGRYSASATHIGIDAIQRDPAGFHASLRAEAQGAGRWSTRDRQLMLDVESGRFTTSNDAITQAAERLRARHSQASQRGRVFYGCRGDHLTTRTEVRPGDTFPTHFIRVAADAR
ncbi:MAG: hypothetical protein LCH70_06110 [Proteobacteria bacterium]|nr:hypothetical protein [Pseudomonadota bacterium]